MKITQRDLMGEAGPEFRPPNAPGIDLFFFFHFEKEKRRNRKGRKMARQKELLNIRGTGRQKRDRNKLHERDETEGERGRKRRNGDIQEKDRKKEREKKRKMERKGLAISRAGRPSCSCRGWWELSPQPCGRQRWVATEILTCQTPSALRGPNQN